MKTTLHLTIAAFGLAVFNVSAQTPAGLDIELYAGLSITGAVGTVYSLEYITDLAETNNASAWRCLEFLQLPASPYLWADKSAPATGKRFYRAVVMQAPTNMVFIPPGTFRMGSPTNEVGRFNNEGPQTEVTISRGFWMGKYEVTQGEFLAVMALHQLRVARAQGRLLRLLSYAADMRVAQRAVEENDRVRATAALGTNGVLMIWSTNGARKAEVWPQGPTNGVRPVGKSRDAAAALFETTNGPTYLWDLEANSLIARLHLAEPLREFAVSPNRRLLYGGGQREGPSWLWNVEAGRIEAAFSDYHTEAWGTAFSHDDRILATGCWRGRLSLALQRQSDKAIHLLRLPSRAEIDKARRAD